MTHDIVIIGGSFAGLVTAHSLLKNTLPRLPVSKQNDIRLTMISPSKQFLFTLASLRALVDPDMIENSLLYQDFLQHFEQYKTPENPNSGLRFIQGYVTALDDKSKSLEINLVDNKMASTTLYYDSVIIATGSSTPTSAFKLTNKSGTETQKDLLALSNAIKAATSIAIGGAGPLGCELAGELGETYPDKKIILYAGTRGVLPSTQPRFGEEVGQRLRDEFGVEVIIGARVSKEELDPNSNQSKLTLSDGTASTVDLYIPASGGTPNTTFLPDSFLETDDYAYDDDEFRPRYVKVDSQMRVSGVPRAYALGESVSSGVFEDIKQQSIILQQILLTELDADDSDLASVVVEGKFEAPQPHDKKFAISLGRYAGVGMLPGGWRIPSIVLRFRKSSHMNLPKSLAIVSGEVVY